MEVFSWSPRSAETVEAFNQRMQNFCDANPVVNVVTSVAHDVVMLSLTEAIDADIESAACFTPRLYAFNEAEMPQLEALMSAEIAALRELDSDETTCIPIQANIYPKSSGAYAVVLISGDEFVADGGDPAPAYGADLDGAIPPALRGGKR